MRDVVTLAVFMAALAGGGLWLLQDGQDGDPPGQVRVHESDYRPGPAWLHRRRGLAIGAAPLGALVTAPLSNIGAAATLGTWTTLP